LLAVIPSLYATPAVNPARVLSVHEGGGVKLGGKNGGKYGGKNGGKNGGKYGGK
jgi:hypothetical protein